MRPMVRRWLRPLAAVAVAALTAPLLTTVGASPAHAQDALGEFTFVDCQAPDGGDGSLEAPVNNLEAINSTTFEPGDQILFLAGTACEGTLRPQGSGTSGAPIVIDTYGEGDKAQINGGGIDATVQLWNQEYWEIRNLEITNIDPHEDDHYQHERRGVVIALKDFGQGDHYRLEGLQIHDVYGEGKKDLGGSGGIQLEVYAADNPADREKTWFNDVVIEDNVVQDVNRSGINMSTAWKCRPEVGKAACAAEWPWVPSTGLVIRSNTVTDVGGDGIVVQMNIGALVEYNTVSDVANMANGSNAAVWAWNADYTTFQYNEVFDTKRLSDNNDGTAFDADYGTTGTVFQYNYSHDNEGGMMLYCGCGGLSTDVTLRYNVSENDHQRTQFVAGGTDVAFYNNTIIAPAEDGFLLNNVNGSGTSMLMANNLFIATENVDDQSEEFPDRNNIQWRNNAFSGPVSGWPDGANNVHIDHSLSPVAGEGMERFKITDPALAGAGTPIAEPGTQDPFGNPVPPACSPDIGAFQFSDTGQDCGIKDARIDAGESLTEAPVAPMATYQVTSETGSVSVQNPTGRVTAPNEHGAAIIVTAAEATTVDLLCSTGQDCTGVTLDRIANSVIDPSYEADANTPWGAWNTQRGTDHVVSGHQGAVIDGVGSTEQRVIHLQPDTEYALQGWVASADGQPVRLGYKNFTGNQDPGDPAQTEDWVEVTKNELTQAGLTFNSKDNTSVSVYCYRPGDGGKGYCDDVSLTAVDPAPEVVRQPEDATVRVGQLAYFTTRYADVNADTVTWQRNSGDGWRPVPDQIGPAMSVRPEGTADSSTQFRAVVSGPGGTVATEPATLTVLPALAAPVVAEGPRNVAADAGDEATFYASASGTPAPTVQWESDAGDGTFTKIEGATSSELTLQHLDAGQDGLQVRAVFTSPFGEVATVPALVRVNGG